MRKVILLAGLACLLAGWELVGQQPDKKKEDDPTPRKEQILKLFVEEFVELTPGQGKFPASFLMGSKDGPPEELPLHKVEIKNTFALAKYEVTQELYHVVMGKNPARWKGPRNSVEMVSWHEAKEFCRQVTLELQKRKLLRDNEEIRLPSEAEWEYACRTGTQTLWSFGNDVKELTHYCWYRDNSKGHDPPVGMKKPNAWGLYDMHGYVWEWVEDDWQSGYTGAPTDGSPRRVKETKERVVRGGGYPTPAEQCRSAYRGHQDADFRRDDIGFRCVRAQVRKEG